MILCRSSSIFVAITFGFVHRNLLLKQARLLLFPIRNLFVLDLHYILVSTLASYFRLLVVLTRLSSSDHVCVLYFCANSVLLCNMPSVASDITNMTLCLCMISGLITIYKNAF
ncbi:unnamed protein product [Amoebophrya sp. A120]|nr:unnamed protein product [Amoebophrya sp. A120]|eukprot:GSA120T00007399001.1